MIVLLENKMPRIEVLFRTADRSPLLEHLISALEAKYGRQDLYLHSDTDSISVPFPDQNEAIQVLLVVIGPAWLEAQNANGGRKLEDSKDPVRVRIETALAESGNPVVIPVLLGNTPFPLINRLPDPIAGLFHTQELKLRPAPRDELDLRRILLRLAAILVETEAVNTPANGEDLTELEEGQGLLARGSRGLVEDVDFLMNCLHSQVDMLSSKQVDRALGLVSTAAGVERIAYYLRHGKPMQRNYAAIYFKRRGRMDLLEEAYQAGLIDYDQGFAN
jgi:hypothetical protein